MLKMIIADDEKIIREGLRDFVDWKQHGIQIIGEAENGKQALQLAEKLHPDILLTDIVMPGINGVQLIETIRDRKWDIQVVFISAHQDKNYIRSAFRYDAVDYIMKPFSDEELVQSIKIVKARIEQRIKQDHQVKQIQSQLNEVQNALLHKQQGFNEFDINPKALTSSNEVNEGREHKIIRQLQQFIHNHLHEELSLNQLAGHAFLSQGHLIYLFKKVTGETVIDYITKLRMEKAKDLLNDQTLKIYQIAEAIGYQDANYFSRLFKKQYGYTPKDYRDLII